MHPLAVGQALLSLADRGIGALVCEVDRLNYASLRSCDWLGCQRLGNVYSFGWGRKRFTIVPRRARTLEIVFERIERMP